MDVLTVCVDVLGLRLSSVESLSFSVLDLLGLLVGFGPYQHISAVWLVLLAVWAGWVCLRFWSLSSFFFNLSFRLLTDAFPIFFIDMAGFSHAIGIFFAVVLGFAIGFDCLLTLLYLPS